MYWPAKPGNKAFYFPRARVYFSLRMGEGQGGRGSGREIRIVGVPYIDV